MDKIIRIAIDGPSGAGKSTIAKMIAKILGFDYIDKGAMYRAIAYKIVHNNIVLSDSKGLESMLNHTEIDFSKGDIILDGERVNDRIRTPEITKMASDASALQEIRDKLVALQRKMGQEKSVVMDGRDIGTNVLTDAEYKFYITASTQTRANRRWLELHEKGEKVSLSDVEKEIIQRDYNDSTRKLNPLRKAEEAIEIDTTGMSIDEVIDLILNKINKQ